MKKHINIHKVINDIIFFIPICIFIVFEVFPKSFGESIRYWPVWVFVGVFGWIIEDWIENDIRKKYCTIIYLVMAVGLSAAVCINFDVSIYSYSRNIEYIALILLQSELVLFHSRQFERKKELIMGGLVALSCIVCICFLYSMGPDNVFVSI